jgi:hypothetical protein
MSATAAGHSASWSLGLSLTSVLHYSRSVGTARLYLPFSSPLTTAFELHTCTTQAKRHVAHIAFAIVGLVTTQPTSWITLTITHHKTNTQGYLSTLCSHQPIARRLLGSKLTNRQDVSSRNAAGEQIHCRPARLVLRRVSPAVLTMQAMRSDLLDPSTHPNAIPILVSAVVVTPPEMLHRCVCNTERLLTVHRCATTLRRHPSTAPLRRCAGAIKKGHKPP